MPRNKYPEETRQKILDAATKLFVEKGFEDTTVLDIIGETGGLTRGAFYHHFKSKDDVLMAALGRYWEQNAPFDNIDQIKAVNGLEKLKKVITIAVGRNVATEANKAMANLTLDTLSSPRFFYQHYKDNLESVQWLLPMIEEGMADGSIPQGNAKVLAELLMLLLNFWIVPQIFPGSDADIFARVDIIERIFDMLGIPILTDEMGEAFASTIGLEIPEDMK